MPRSYHFRAQLRRCEARLAELASALRRDPVSRPGVVEDHLDLGLRAEPAHRVGHLVAHDLQGGAAEEGGRELDVHALVLDLHVADDAEIDDRDDRNLRIRDLGERLPDLTFGYHAAPGTERRTIVISSRSGTSSSVCEPRSTGSTGSRPTTSQSRCRCELSRRPNAYGHSSSMACSNRRRVSSVSRMRSAHMSACMRWYVSSRSILAARPATSPSSEVLSAPIRIASAF